MLWRRLWGAAFFNGGCPVESAWSLPRPISWAIEISVEAISAAAVGQPRWSATTRKPGR
jgi:hypothetical protein